MIRGWPTMLVWMLPKRTTCVDTIPLTLIHPLLSKDLYRSFCTFIFCVVVIFLVFGFRYVVAEPLASGVGLEFASRTIDLSFTSGNMYRLETDHAALQYSEHYAYGAKGWVAVRYMAATLFDHPVFGGQEMTGHALDLGVGRTWDVLSWLRLSMEANYNFQQLDGVGDRDDLRLRWHNPSLQAKAIISLTPFWNVETAFVGQKIDGVIRGSDMEASKFRDTHEFGASVGIAWEIDPGGYVRLTMVRLVEASTSLQFTRDFNF